MSFKLIKQQIELIEQPLNQKIYLEGSAGTGKTTVGVERMLHLMACGIRGENILVLLPQRTLAEPYQEALRHPGLLTGGMVNIVTIGGLARRMIDLFWPLVSDKASFSKPDELPIFLTLETAQYYMAHVAKPLLVQGFFSSVVLERNRLYSQIIDNLNKAAIVGFPHTEIGERLNQAWSGEPVQMRVYQDVQTCANLFREYCLQNNLLDFSLQVELFWQYIWRLPLCRKYLSNYKHLIADNMEEDTPLTHDLLQEWIPEFQSCLIIVDKNAGFRQFLGSSPDTAERLKSLCSSSFEFEKNFGRSREMMGLETQLLSVLDPRLSQEMNKTTEKQTSRQDRKSFLVALEHEHHRFFPQMLDWVAECIHRLVHDENIPPGQIVVLAPFLSDALRFSLTTRLEGKGINTWSHRPSRSLREEPSTHCLLTLAALAHPHWGIIPTPFDVAYSLMQAIDGLDLIRAQLLTNIVYRKRDGKPTLSSFDQIITEMQLRISYLVGERFEQLRAWLVENQHIEQEFDHFLSRLFGEILSQPGFGFHNHLDRGRVSASLIESVQKFRQVAGITLDQEGIPLGKEYLLMVEEGLIAAQYIFSWQIQPEDAILIAPAYTFLMSNRQVDVQFWLDVGSAGWQERLYQPLTHPYVLSRNWAGGRKWTDYDEVNAAEERLYRLIAGLLRRCRQKVFLGMSEFNEQGYEQRGPLLMAFQKLLLLAGS